MIEDDIVFECGCVEGTIKYQQVCYRHHSMVVEMKKKKSLVW